MEENIVKEKKEKKKVSELLLEKLNQYGYHIHNEDDVNDHEKFFVLDDAIISTDEEKRFMVVSYHLSSKIEDSVILALNLKEIKGARLYVGSSFTFNDEGNYIDGEEAEKYYESKKIDGIVQSFVEDQSQKHFLAHTDGYKC